MRIFLMFLIPILLFANNNKAKRVPIEKSSILKSDGELCLSRNSCLRASNSDNKYLISFDSVHYIFADIDSSNQCNIFEYSSLGRGTIRSVFNFDKIIKEYFPFDNSNCGIDLKNPELQWMLRWKYGVDATVFKSKTSSIVVIINIVENFKTLGFIMAEFQIDSNAGFYFSNKYKVYLGENVYKFNDSPNYLKLSTYTAYNKFNIGYIFYYLAMMLSPRNVPENYIEHVDGVYELEFDSDLNIQNRTLQSNKLRHE